MESNSAKKAPILDRLVDIGKTRQNSAKQAPNNLANNNANKPVNLMPNNTAPTPQANAPQATPTNRRIDKSDFEIRLGDIVDNIIRKHVTNASDEIVQEVLREVRARLPGKRKE